MRDFCRLEYEGQEEAVLREHTLNTIIEDPRTLQVNETEVGHVFSPSVVEPNRCQICHGSKLESKREIWNREKREDDDEPTEPRETVITTYGQEE
jgi:hypothetical protein